VRVNAEQVNLRPSPGTDEPPLRKLYLDERLAVLECSGVPAGEHLWWRVVGEDGQEGWVATTWLEAVR
jgi:SH3-like domain-containing protein